MNILVTGANGQLGTHMRLLSPQSHHQYFFTDIAELDITCREAVMAYVRENQIELVVNCAAYTNVDRAESDEDNADRVNHLAVAYLAEAMKNAGGWLLHVSTDYVFGGAFRNIPCTEDIPANPTGAYGRTKLAGEQAIIASGCHYLIFRTAWLYSEYGKNFLLTMLNLTATKPQLKVVFDQAGTPTYAGDLAKSLFAVVEHDLYIGHEGIYNYSNEGVCSWFDFAREIARQAGHTDCDIQPCHSSEFPSPVVRPAYSVLDKSKFKETFGLKVPYWTDSLGGCLKNLHVS